MIDIANTIPPEKHHSHASVGSRRSSSKSGSSSITSASVKAAAKKAVLFAEAATLKGGLKERRDIETEQFMLQQKKRAFFYIKFEIAHAYAAEKAYSAFEQDTAASVKDGMNAYLEQHTVSALHVNKVDYVNLGVTM